MYIGDYLARRQLYSPEQLAIVDAGKNPEWRLTYRQMNERANRLANWLQAQAGLGKGDRVAILARDGVEHLDCFFACSKLGAIHTALNWRLHWQELVQIFQQTTPKLLIFSDDFHENVAHLHQALQDEVASISKAYYKPLTSGRSPARAWKLRISPR
jgi:fatty-acyl-CoA synthase